MNQGEGHTRKLLRDLKEKGNGDIASQLSSETARELLKTPPTNASLRAAAAKSADGTSSGVTPSLAAEDVLSIRSRGGLGGAGGGGGTSSANNLPLLDPSQDTKEMVRQLEEDTEAFNTGLVDNTRLAKEQMQRSLLQLFEDTAREKLLSDPSILGLKAIGGGGGTNSSSIRGATSGGGGGTPQSPGSINNSMNSKALASPLQGVLRPSKRPTDRGLDRRDAPSEIIIPDSVRESIGKDIMTVVDHELRRFGNVIMGDLSKIMNQVVGVRDRMCRLEEDLLQRDVESKMQAEQLTQSSSLVNSLQDQVNELQDHMTTKDSQMDLLRDQVSRRNHSLDETRIKFRKEVNRYKHRVYELETELEGFSGSSMAGGRRGKRLSIAEIVAEEDNGGEISAATENAIKDVTEKMQEEIRQLNVKFAREKKTLVGEMTMKLSERDQEILRLKKKLREANSKINESSAEFA